MSSSAHIDNKKNYISSWKRSTQRLQHILTAEKCIPLVLLLQKRNSV